MTDDDCPCILCRDHGGPDSWSFVERMNVENVRRTGWGVIGVADDFPGWAYTVGLWHSYRMPEVAMSGLNWPDMGHWLNTFVELTREQGQPDIDEPFMGVLSDHPVRMRPVDYSWAEGMFGQVASFYRTTLVPIRQMVWPDRHGRWPWEQEALVACRVNQPRTWQPVSAEPQERWRLIGRAGPDWPFWPTSPGTLVVTTQDVASGQRDIAAAVYSHDGYWQFLDDRTVYSEDDLCTAYFGHLFANRPWLAEIADLPPGHTAWRDDTGEWRRTPLPLEGT